MFGANRAHILHQHKQCLQIDQNEIACDPHHLAVPSGVSKVISEPVVRSAQTVHISCTDTNTISKQTMMSFHLSLITWSTIGCVQNDFLVYGMFGRNYGPILLRH
jgi:hypothetical protein